MRMTREKALATLKQLNPAPVFLDSYHKKQLPENLDIFFGPPEEFFMTIENQDPYNEGRLVPILDDGNFGVVTFFDPLKGLLVQKDVEDPDNILRSFQNWQQFVASIVTPWRTRVMTTITFGDVRLSCSSTTPMVCWRVLIA